MICACLIGKPVPTPSASQTRVNALMIKTGASFFRDKRACNHPDDPRGCCNGIAATTKGRRIDAKDRRQIKRWKAMRRHVRQIERHCEPGELSCRARQRRRCCIGLMTAGRFSYPMPMGMACSTSTMMARMMMLQMVAPIPRFHGLVEARAAAAELADGRSR